VLNPVLKPNDLVNKSHFKLGPKDEISLSKDLHFKHPDSEQKRGSTLQHETSLKNSCSKKMKIEEYTHDFKLAYGTPKRGGRCRSFAESAMKNESETKEIETLTESNAKSLSNKVPFNFRRNKPVFCQ
jgi:hypothetical protein